MSVLPIRRASAANMIAAELRDALLSGLFAPGTPLMTGDLAERVGSHPATVRAALAELEQDGLVVHSLQRGLEVAPLTRDELHDIYSARRVLRARWTGGVAGTPSRGRELARRGDRAHG